MVKYSTFIKITWVSSLMTCNLSACEHKINT